MFTVTTSEIRWFFKGEIPEETNNWFQNLKGEVETQAPRTDVYLNSKDTPNLGIKFREGRFEIKQKIEELSELNSHNISGKAELWKKWSFRAEGEGLPIADISKGEWVEITKTRKLKKYIFSVSNEIIMGFDNYKSDGCSLELTDLKYNSEVFWTIGLETYGKTEKLKQNLEIAFQYVFKQAFPGEFTTQHSYGYPKWLCL